MYSLVQLVTFRRIYEGVRLPGGTKGETAGRNKGWDWRTEQRVRLPDGTKGETTGQNKGWDCRTEQRVRLPDETKGEIAGRNKRWDCRTEQRVRLPDGTEGEIAGRNKGWDCRTEQDTWLFNYLTDVFLCCYTGPDDGLLEPKHVVHRKQNKGWSPFKYNKLNCAWRYF